MPLKFITSWVAAWIICLYFIAHLTQSDTNIVIATNVRNCEATTSLMANQLSSKRRLTSAVFKQIIQPNMTHTHDPIRSQLHAIMEQ